MKKIIMLIMILIISCVSVFSVTCTLHDPTTFNGSACGGITVGNSEINGYDSTIPADVYDNDLGTGIYNANGYSQLLFLNDDITSVIVEIETSGGQYKNTTLPLDQCIMDYGFLPQYTDPYMLITLQDNFNGNDFESILSCSFNNTGIHDDLQITDPIVEDGGTAEVWIHFEYTPAQDITEPVVTVNNLTTTNTTPILSGTVDDNSAVITITIDGQEDSATNNGDGTWQINWVTELSVGTYDVSVNATDLSGNSGYDATTDELIIEEIVVPVVQRSSGSSYTETINNDVVKNDVENNQITGKSIAQEKTTFNLWNWLSDFWNRIFG